MVTRIQNIFLNYLRGEYVVNVVHTLNMIQLISLVWSMSGIPKVSLTPAQLLVNTCANKPHIPSSEEIFAGH